MGDKLIKLFLELPKPNKDGIYNVVHIPQSRHKIGKSINGSPVLLISVIKESEVFPSDLKLKYLSICYNISCKLSSNGKIKEGNYVILEYLNSEIDLSYPFLKIALLIVKILGNNPKTSEIKSAVDKFVNLFKALSSPPKKSVQGLWGELFVIYNSTNPKKMLEAWHNSPHEKYDFSYLNSRIEVKSNSGRQRIHTFLYEQLTPPSNIYVVIASVFAEPNNSGKSVEELASSIMKRLHSDSKSSEKLYEIIFSTLGCKFQEIKEIRFDLNLAGQSVRFYDFKQVPCICKIHKPVEVSNIKFACDISSVKSIEKKNLRKKGKLFQYV